MSIREGIAKETHEFVHRGKTHLTWEELPIRYGKKAYREFADQIISLLKAEIEKGELTDEEFFEWCGSHIVKGCGGTRRMEGADREVSICEDCRAQAQIDKVLKLLEEK